MDDKKTELESATSSYVAAADALAAIHSGGAELVGPTPMLAVPDNYDDLLQNYRDAAKRYADALRANDYAVPASLEQEAAG